MVQKEPIKICDIDVHNIVISKLIEMNNNSEYLTGSLDDVIRPLFLILPKMSGLVKTFKYKKSKLLFLDLHDKILQKYRTVWTEIEVMV